MKGYYVDLVRKGRRAFTLLAGPFKNERIARLYQVPAHKAAIEIDPLYQFDTHGVLAMEHYRLPGLVNDRLHLDPADLLTSDATELN